MIEFTKDDDIVKVLLENMEKSVLSLLYFTASWCGPCQKIKPFLDELSDKLKENGEYNIEFYKIDIDKNEDFCNKCDIKSVPTFFIMNGKDLLSSLNGANKMKLSEIIVETFNKFNSNKHIKNK
jgi:thiol-disulfide isomerase/thioredoxin